MVRHRFAYMSPDQGIWPGMNAEKRMFWSGHSEPSAKIESEELLRACIDLTHPKSAGVHIGVVAPGREAHRRSCHYPLIPQRRRIASMLKHTSNLLASRSRVRRSM